MSTSTLGIDKIPQVQQTRVRSLWSFLHPLLVLLAYDLGYALVKILFYVARSPTVVSERSMRRHRYG